MNFDVAEWGPPLAVMLGGIGIGALFLRGRGNAEAAVIDEGRRSDLEANQQAAIDALRQLELDKDKLEPDVYRREREALIERGAAAMRTLDTAEPATDLVARLQADRARVGDVAFFDAVRQVAPEVSARGAAPSGIAPEWKGAGWATLFCALLGVLTWMATSESVDRREGASMTGNQDLGGPPGGPPQEWLQAKAAEEAKLLANPNDLDAKNNLTQLHLSAGDATKAMERNRQVLEADPKNADGRVFKAVLAATVGMYDKALVELDAVLANNPGHVKAQTYRA
ncbi:MAG: tetratricopeptide repeat protein, partial [Deltaproteobacteria bacterium]|nr:tetratricopeptide repeat protein [Deltaproteobacteria bacterium]